MKRFPTWTALAGLLLAASGPAAFSQTVVDGDQVVQGGACIGFDCPTSPDFADHPYQLLENNLRIRLTDTVAAPGLGQSWNIEANDSPGGGASYFRIERKSVVEELIISDGTAPVYDCTQLASTEDPEELLVPDTFIPAGEPVVTPQSPASVFDPDSGTVKYQFECLEFMDFVRSPVVDIGAGPTGAVALGAGSDPLAGQVSVGDAAGGLLRRLRHLAEGIRETDLATVGMLPQTSLDEAEMRVQQLEQTVRELEGQLSLMESTDSDDDGVPDVVDDFPAAETRVEVGGSVVLETAPASVDSSCTVDSASLTPLAGLAPAPERVTVVGGDAVNFTMTGCAPGEVVTVSLDLGTALPPGTAAYKVGAGWSRIPGATVSGGTIRYEVRDGGPLDADGQVNGTIVDPVAVGVPDPEQVPALPLWLLGLLTAALGGLGMWRACRL